MAAANTERAARRLLFRSTSTAQQRIIAVPVILGATTRIRAGVAGTVYYLEAPFPQSGGETGVAAGSAAAAARCIRYQLSDRRAAPFVTGVAELRRERGRPQAALSHWPAVAAAGGRAAREPAGRSSSSMPIANAAGRPGRLNVTLRMYLDPREEFKQIFNEGWRNQRDYLYVQNARRRLAEMKEMYGQLLPYVNHRADLNYLLDNMGAEIAVGHSYVRGGDMPEVAAIAWRPARRRLHGRERPLQDHAHLRHRELEPRPARAARGAGRGRHGRRLHPRDQRHRAERADNIYRLLDGTANRQTCSPSTRSRCSRARAR